jgi:hypothetical protein
LAQSEAELDRVSPHRRWIKRIYVRLLRFLLAVYGRGDWTADETQAPTDGAETVEDDSHEAHAELVDLRTETGGTPPKSVAEIRRALKTVHAAGSAQHSGPHAEGLQPEDWIVVASRRDGVVLRRFAEALYLAGIPCRRRRLGRDGVIEVRFVHEEEALELLQNLGSSVRESSCQRRARRSRPLAAAVAALTCLLVGGLLPVLAFVTSDAPHGVVRVNDLLVMVFIGLLVGGVIGCLAAWQIARGGK